MNSCEDYREAISALLDDEPSTISGTQTDAHLAACEGCATYAARVEQLNRRVRITAAEAVPDLTAEILVAVTDAKQGRRAGRRPGLRELVGLAGLVQVILGLVVLSGVAGDHVRLGLGAFEVALGVGLLAAAWQP